MKRFNDRLLLGVIRPRLTGVFNVAQGSGAPPVTVVGDWLSPPHRQRLQGGRMSVCVQPVELADGYLSVTDSTARPGR
jgi:hypothetical protein